MSTHLTQINQLPRATATKLDDLRKRRQWLMTLRAIAATLLVLLTSLFIGVCIDSLIKLNEPGRWGVSLSVYVAVAAAFFISVLPFWRKWGVSEAATVIESEVAPLKNQLLSAVELATDSTDPRYGSKELRNRLQHKVAQEIESVTIGKILPWNRIQKWLAASGVGLAVFGMLCAIPSLQIPSHAMRVLFPFANLARPSLAQLDILLPSPASTNVALSELLAFQVAISGPGSEKIQSGSQVSLEIRDAEQINSVVTKTMLLEKDTNTSEGRQILSTTYMIENERIEYRIVSDVAESPWHILQAFPRPVIKSFTKSITPPQYAKASPVVTESPEADVEAVVGSIVQWKIDTNVAIREAKLRWIDDQEAEDKIDTVAFEKQSDGRWAVSVDVQQSGRFQIEMISEAGLASTFPTSFRLQALTDQPAQLAWVVPKELSQVIRPRSATKLSAAYTDEFPLNSLEQHVRINRGAWMSTPRALEEKNADELAWNWEMASYSLKVGDFVETKLVAIDRKNQVSESAVIEWAISGTELDSSRETGTLARENIADQIGELAQQAKEIQEELKPTVDAWRAAQDKPELAEALVEQLAKAGENLAAKSKDVRRAIENEMAQVDDPISLQEMTLTADTLARLEAEDAQLLTEVEQSIEAAKQAATDPKAAIQKAQQTAEQLLRNVQRVEQNYDRFVAPDVLSDLSKDLSDAAKYQEELLRDPTQLGSDLWKREENLLGDHLRDLAREMDRQADYLPEGPANQLRQKARWAEQQADRIATLTSKETPIEPAKREQMQREFEQVRVDLENNQSLQALHGNAPQEALQARREMQDMSGSAAEVVQRAAKDWRDQRNQQADPSQLPKQSEIALDQLMDRRDARLARSDINGRDAADLGTAFRAIENQVKQQGADPQEIDKKLNEISDAIRKVEAAERLENAQAWIDHLLETERWAANSTEARNENPRVWDAVSQEFENASQAIRQAALPNEVADAVQALRWSPEAAQASQKIGDRRWSREDSVTAAGDLETLQAKLQEQSTRIANQVAEAREKLQELAPSVPQIAREAAKEVAEEKGKTEKLKQEVAAGEVPSLNTRLPDPAEESSDARDLDEQLQAALVDLAASSNLLDSTERSQAEAADLGREMVAAADQRMQQAVEEARNAESGETSKKLDELSKAQEHAEETFAAIAEHFERDPLKQQKSSNGNETSNLAELANAELKKAIADPYREAERLAALAEADPRSLLKSLEKELETNPEMQEALAEIASNLAEQTKESLEFAAERERSQRTALEQSDPTFQPRKQQFQQELAMAIEQADRVARRLAQEAQSQAASAGKQDRQNQLQQAAQEIKQSADQARTANGQSPMNELAQAAQQLQQALQNVQPKLQDVAQGLAGAAQEKKFEDDAKRQQAKAQLEKAQKQWQDQDVQSLAQVAKTREQQAQAAQRVATQAQQQMDQSQQRKDNAKAQLDKQPQSDGLQQQLRAAEADLAEKQAIKQVADALKQQADQRVTQAAQQRDQAATPQGALDSQNPNAELAARLTQQAATRTSDLSNSLNQMLNEAGWKDQLQAAQSQLASSAQQQNAIRETVADAARDLDRAAAHQERLNAMETAKQLADAAQRVGATAQQEPKTAQSQLEAASQSSEAQSVAKKASTAMSQGVQQALQNAQNAVQQRANELESMLAAQQAESAQNQKSPVESANQSGQPQGNPDANAPNPTPSNSTTPPGNNPTSNNPGSLAQSSQSASSNSPSSQNANANNNQEGESNSNSQDQSAPLSPQEMAQLLDELDRQLRSPEGNVPADSLAQSQSQNGQPLQNSLQKSAQDIAQQLQSMRPANEGETADAMVPVMMNASTAKVSKGILVPNPNGSGAVKVLATDEMDSEPIGAWSRLREKKSEEVVEGQREKVASRYRRQVENYFKNLSERSRTTGDSKGKQ